MSIKEKFVEQDGFKGRILTLVCENTNKKLANILVQRENSELDIPQYVKVRAITEDGKDSGYQTVGGKIHYSGISDDESPLYPTSVVEVINDGDVHDDTPTLTIKVQPYETVIER